jgi:hypothetical protein
LRGVLAGGAGAVMGGAVMSVAVILGHEFLLCETCCVKRDIIVST